MADHSLLGAPTLSAEGLKKVLCENSAPTPLVDLANELYAHTVGEGANPAVVLGIYGRESSFGRTGMALTTKAIGNERPRDLPKGHPARLGRARLRPRQGTLPIAGGGEARRRG